MRVFVGISYGRDHETAICGAADCRETARRMVELSRHEMLSWAREATDGPDGGAGLDDAKGDLVGRVLAFDVAGNAALNWRLDEEGIFAESIYHDQGSPLHYTVSEEITGWVAALDGHELARGSLEHCMTACRKSEDDAILQAIQNQKEHDESWARPNDFVGNDKHGRMLWMLKRMLDPEDLGYAVPAHVRDDVRDVLGMPRCEFKVGGGSSE